MAANTRSDFQRNRDLRETARLYLHGMTQADIGVKLKVSQRQVSYDLRVLQRRWLDASVIDIDVVKAKELARIDEVERQAYRGWHRSLKDAETKRKAAKNTSDGVQTEAHEETKGQAGDPRFLTIVLTCIERRCKIFGLDAAIKVSWQEQAKADGYDPNAIIAGLESDLFKALVQAGMGRSVSGGADKSEDRPTAS